MTKGYRRKGPRWTLEQVRWVRDLEREEKSVEEIAVTVGLSVAIVKIITGESIEPEPTDRVVWCPVCRKDIVIVPCVACAARRYKRNGRKEYA